MTEDHPPTREDFLMPKSRYRGEFKPEKLVFDNNLQEFAAQIGYICSLESSGKLSGAEAYDRIKSLWKALKRSKKALNLTDEDPHGD